MRDPARIERITRMLKATWLESPDQRFGQLLENNVLPELNEKNAGSAWEVEDAEIERRLTRLINAGPR